MSRTRQRHLWLLLSVLTLASTAPLSGQQIAAQASRRANWPLANRFSSEALRTALFSTSVTPRWIGETDSMWYTWRDASGNRFVLVAPKTKLRRPLFDHVQFAQDLSTLHHKAYDPNNLPITTLTFTEKGDAFRFLLDSIRYEYSLPTAQLRSLGRPTREELTRERTQAGAGGRGGAGGGGGGGANADFRNYSPDSTAFAFAREHNLFVVNVATKDTAQVTTDGVRYYSFGARDTTQQQQQQQEDQQQNEEERQAAQTRSRDPRVRANVTWSPDSKAFFVVRNDDRKVSELYLVDVLASPRPKLVSYKYAMPGEENVTQQELFTYKRGDTKLTPTKMARWKDQRLFDLHWTIGSDRMRLVRRDRPQRKLELIELDIATGQTTQLLSEEVENAYLERQNVRYMKAGGDFLWWSERNGWGHLYLYSFDGKPKRAVTSGPWRVDALVQVDTMKRTVFFRGVGKEPTENPYYAHLYRTVVDGGPVTLLDAGNATHASTLSPSKRFAVDNYSRVDLPAKSVVRDERGAVWMELEESDITKLKEMGWKAPEHFVVKAADGYTDIYGVMWKPFDFDSNKRYPIIAHVYPGPQTETVTFTFSPTNTNQRLAQLGFVVIQIGNRGGSPTRSNAYHSYGYYNLRDYGLADKKAGIEQLASRYAFIDIDRVGIYGHSGGGFMTAAALLEPPYNDFFKVGVSSSGNHDNNVYNQNWSEQHHGLKETRTADGKVVTDGNGGGDDQAQDNVKFEINVPANTELAANLKGKLMLVHGDMDNNVHPAGTIRLANALIKANKRFDMFIFPGKPHGYGDMQNYFNRMMYEYFAEHLLGDYYRADATIK